MSDSPKEREGHKALALGDGFSQHDFQVFYDPDAISSTGREIGELAEFGAASANFGPVIHEAYERAAQLGIWLKEDNPSEEKKAASLESFETFQVREQPYTHDWYLIKIFWLDLQLKKLQGGPPRTRGSMTQLITWVAMQLGAFCREYTLSFERKR